MSTMAARAVFLFVLAGISVALRQTRQISASTKVARVLTPADGAEYVAALSVTNRNCPLRCAAEIVQPSSTEELAAWLTSNNGAKPFIVKGGGHSYGCQSVPADGGVLIHTARLNNAEVFKRKDGTSFLRTGPGLTFDQLIPRLNMMNYSMPHGECLTVGMGGWTLNLGNHPELGNFNNKWGYDGKAYLSKVTFVDYRGTVFYVDKDGMHLVKLSPNDSWISYQVRRKRTEALAGIMNVAGKLGGSDIVAAGNVMRIFKFYGANIAIATELEIELLPKPEPGFFQVTYAVSEILDKNGGKERLQAIWDAVWSAGADEDIDCGMVYFSDYFKGTKEGAIALKCVDWASPSGDTVRRIAPAGYRAFQAKASGFLIWAKDSYGKGWVPSWHGEDPEQFVEAGGVEKYRDFVIALESAANPCDSVGSELMYNGRLVMVDNFAVASQANQDACAAFSAKLKDILLGDRPIIYKQNLPMCRANSDWKSELIEYSNGLNIVANRLKKLWDEKRLVDFWLGIGHDNSQACEALSVQPAGQTCLQHGITSDQMVEAEHNYAKRKCPKYDSYVDSESQNNNCVKHIYKVATPLPVTVM